MTMFVANLSDRSNEAMPRTNRILNLEMMLLENICYYASETRMRHISFFRWWTWETRVRPVRAAV